MSGPREVLRVACGLPSDVYVDDVRLRAEVEAWWKGTSLSADLVKHFHPDINTGGELFDLLIQD